MDFSSLKSYEEIKGSLYYNYDVYNLIENQGVLAQKQIIMYINFIGFKDRMNQLIRIDIVRK